MTACFTATPGVDVIMPAADAAPGDMLGLFVELAGDGARR